MRNMCTGMCLRLFVVSHGDGSDGRLVVMGDTCVQNITVVIV